MMEILDEYLYHFIAGIIGLGIVLFFLIRKKKSTKRENIIICGPNLTGKTSFFYNLVSNKSQMTVTSMKVNQYGSLYLVPDNKIKFVSKVIDIPGIGYFRNKVKEDLENAKIVLLFIDSSEKKSLNEASEYAYDVINSEFFDENMSLIIVCNMTDKKFAKGSQLLQSELENEIDSKKKIKQKNNLEDQTEQMGKLFVS
jgi:GTPase SAR1 family protein